ncbi:MAG: hypothetical protein ACREJ3_10185 [Polyangiaceae bacterium]
MLDDPDRGEPSSLRGRLSEIYFPALVSSQSDQLLRRLGDRATVDDPIFGRTSRAPALTRYLDEISVWLAKRQGSFEKTAFVTGSDRDVTEGSLALTFDGRRVTVPVAVVAERRPEREIELRLYYSTKPIKGTHAVRSPLLPKNDEVTVPPPVEAQIAALARGDAAAVVASFETGGMLRDAAGQSYLKEGDGGPLLSFYEKLLSNVKSPVKDPATGIEMLKGARADDGKICALEYTVVRIRAKAVAPQAGMAVYERGDSGLLRAVRVYEDIDLHAG